ncbi:MAG: hypothetical protein CMF75_02420 [Maricaulis sp.]|nr:hypothetical protein [Maricaulis sp.]
MSDEADVPAGGDPAENLGMTGQAEAPTGEDDARERLVFNQSATWGGILPITLLNALLNIITLTLWRFWGRTRVRRYLWSTTTVNGTPLEYTGSGWELFRSFIVVMLFVLLPIYAVMFAGQLLLPPEQFMLYFGLAYIPIILLFSWLLGVAVWVARRYRLSRTTWRGIRLGQSGSANRYAWASVGYSILTSLTLGWFAPAAEMRLTRMLWADTFYGDHRFSVPQGDEGLAGPTYGAFALAWIFGLLGYFAFIAVYMVLVWDTIEAGGQPDFDIVLIVKIYAALLVYMIIVGIFSLPYAAALLRRKAQIVSFEGVRFTIRANTFSLGWVYALNFVIIAGTLGLGLPIAQMRLWRYIFKRLEAEGEIDIASIRQNADKGPKSGEGLADAFDIGNVI